MAKPYVPNNLQRRDMLWYLLKPKTRLLTSRTKLNLPLETNIQIQMFGLTL